jgi:DDE superfamily endonuclease
MKKLIELEESVIIQYTLNLDSRGFSPQLSLIRDMANKLLAVYTGRQVGIRWPSNFVKRSPELKTRFNRKYNYQRALNEDPKII